MQPAIKSQHSFPDAQQLGRAHHDVCSMQGTNLLRENWPFSQWCYLSMNHQVFALVGSSEIQWANACIRAVAWRGVRGPRWVRRPASADTSPRWSTGPASSPRVCQAGWAVCQEPAPLRCGPAPRARCSLPDLPSAVASAILLDWSSCNPGRRLFSNSDTFFCHRPTPSISLAFSCSVHLLAASGSDCDLVGNLKNPDCLIIMRQKNYWGIKGCSQLLY